MTEPVFTIGELARKFKVSHRALRFYEKQGLLSPERDKRRRLYSQRDADRLSAILKAKKLGFTLREIGQLIAGGNSGQPLQLTREKCLKQIERLERQLAEIKGALTDLRLINESVARAETRVITLGSTSSTQDSGLFNFILPIFKAATGLDVHVVAVGTGQAFAIAQRGDADALFVHDRVGEDKFIADGFGIDRRDVMHDDFIIVGPSTDPANIRGLKDAKRAFTQIAAANAPFVSRGDDSGTHRMELRIWKSAGVEHEPGNVWYRDLNLAMAQTLKIAATSDAYTLTDRATWENFKNRQNLEILTEGDPALVNPYASIVVNPVKCPQAKFNEAWIWHEWLTTKPGRDAIASYRIGAKNLYFLREQTTR